MQKILIISIWLCSLTVMAQRLEDLEKQNTLFLVFEEDEFSQKMKTIPKELEPIFYTFYYKKKNSLKKTSYSFRLSYHKFNNYEDIANNKQTMMYRVHKSFLKKNKHLILSKKDIDVLGENTIIQLFKNKRKHLFIIDKSETKDKQILIRKVLFDYDAYE